MDSANPARTRTLITAVAVLLLTAGPECATASQSPEPTGRITGIVRLQGRSPTLSPRPVYKHTKECGVAIADERLMLGENGAVQNVIVYVADLAAAAPAESNRPLLLDNRECAFVPHVQTASVGQTLSIRNSDPFLHDAHAWLGQKTLFNVGLPKGKTVDKVLDEPGLIRVDCNVRHTWMRAYIFVSENPFHAVTDAAGRFVIDGLPAGSYRLRFWHELLGVTERPVIITADGNTAIEVQLEPALPGEQAK